MSKNNILLEPLIEPPLPQSVSWWPQTIGWKVLAVILFIVLCYWLYLRLQQWRQNRYRREALKSLQLVDGLPAEEAMLRLNQVVKQAASVAFGHERVARLYGDEWLEFLSQTATPDFNSSEAQKWQAALYQPSLVLTQAELKALISQCQQWLLTHEVQPQMVTSHD